MSTRDDATLSAQERAAFAQIEARAIAEDPTLGASLAVRIEQRLRRMVPLIRRNCRRRSVSVVTVVVGLALVVVGLSATVALAIAGLALIVIGAVPLAGMVLQRVTSTTAQAASERRWRNEPPSTG